MNNYKYKKIIKIGIIKKKKNTIKKLNKLIIFK